MPEKVLNQIAHILRCLCATPLRKKFRKTTTPKAESCERLTSGRDLTGAGAPWRGCEIASCSLGRTYDHKQAVKAALDTTINCQIACVSYVHVTDGKSCNDSLYPHCVGHVYLLTGEDTSHKRIQIAAVN